MENNKEVKADEEWMKIILNSYFWVFFVLFMYEMFGVILNNNSFVDAIDYLVVEFAPTTLIYIAIVFQKNILYGKKEQS
jgi:hypothetical protein